MNKSISIIIVLTLFLLGTSCGNKPDPVEQNISYLQSGYLVGKDNEFTIIITAGDRESPYAVDGIKGDLIEFFLITVTPTSSAKLAEDYTFSFTHDGKSIIGELKLDPYGNSFIADTGIKEQSNGLTAITLTSGDNSTTISLTDAMANMITSNEALNIARTEYADKILEETDDGVFQREVYIKYISDSTSTNVNYYWYIAFIGSANNYWAMLISPITGDIIAKRG